MFVANNTHKSYVISEAAVNVVDMPGVISDMALGTWCTFCRRL